jgi:hypothetical protein
LTQDDSWSTKEDIMRARLSKLALAGAVTGIVCLGASPALADSPDVTTYTVHQHDTFVESAFNPCTLDPIAITSTENSVFHITQSSAGDGDQGTDFWATSTVTGAESFVDNGVTYSGRYMLSDGEDVNLQNEVYRFRSSFRVVGSDGTVLTGSVLVHITWSTYFAPPVVGFEFTSLTCG